MEFRLESGGECIILVGQEETEAVKLAAANLAKDLERTVGVTARVVQEEERHNSAADAAQVVQEEERHNSATDAAQKDGKEREERAQDITAQAGAFGRENLPTIRIGTLGVSAIVQDLAADFLPRTESGCPHREAYLHRVLHGDLIIAGSDRRGTVYGIYELCEALGVSPWYFFADVPVRRRQEFVLPQEYVKTDYPSVEYRGIFINDEEELEAWVQNYMGEPTIGVRTYEKIFELLLRLKANYIWPAMHVNSFNLTPENGALADRMGIVVGTSHCDMLMRSNNREWKPWLAKKGYTDASYDYSIEGRNREILQEYWRESVEQNQAFEVCYTLGMRGIHDSGFETKNLKAKTKEEIRSAKKELLEKIIADQREILSETLGHDTMMTFIPYKEVLELYDSGLSIPEDVTLVWANDNYGYIRRYPSGEEKKRKGGNGIYYHNSYWAPPSMSYVFLCSIPLAHTRNELKKAWEEGIRKLWVLNVGAIKPLEQEITFFLQLAWEIGKPGAVTQDVEGFVEKWIDRTFSGQCGKQVSRLLNDFSQLTNVRKIENMDYGVFSQTAYGDEAAVRIARYEELFAKGNTLYGKLPKEERDAFFQLVLMRIHAAYFTNLAFYNGDRSTLMYERGNMQAADYYTEKSKEAEDARRYMLHYYNHVMCGGKWRGVLDPEGFPPPRAAMLPVCTPALKIEGKPRMRADLWNEAGELCFAAPGEKWIEFGNTGNGAFALRLQKPAWVRLSEEYAVVSREKRILVDVSEVSENRAGEIVAENLTDGSVLRIPVRTVKTEGADAGCAVEEDGLIVLEAGAFWEAGSGKTQGSAQKSPQSAAPGGGNFRYVRRLGRMQGDLLEACVQRETGNEEVCGKWKPDGAKSRVKGAVGGEETDRQDLPKVRPFCCRFATRSSGEFLLEIHRFPSLNSVGKLRIGISLDEGPVQVAESFSNDEWRGNWKENVLDNVDRLSLKLAVPKAGAHRLFVWALDRYFAFSRMVIYTSPRKENNLAGIRGKQPLPTEWEMREWCDAFYGKWELPPRPTFYAAAQKDADCLGATCRVVQAKRWGKRVTPEWYLQKGARICGEANGAIRIDAAAALAQSKYAWTAGKDRGLWQHCRSESFGRSGLAMYIRTPKKRWEPEEAPSLNYRIRCRGGNYTLWMLSKFNVYEESFFGVGVDGGFVPQEELYGNGGLWCYEAEQIYRWVPAARLCLKEGEHVLQLFALASGMRYDRFYLAQGEGLPPMDMEWV